MKTRLMIALAVLLVLVIGCAKTAETPVAAAEEPGTVAESNGTAVDAVAAENDGTATETKEEPMEDYDNKVAELKTDAGTIVMRFFPEKAPNHVKNFIELSRSGFYNGTKFHRIIPGFMIQGGDPNTKNGDPSTWGTGGSGTRLKAEFNDISHKRGIVSMARSNDPDSASSQFFIVTSDSTFLDNNYTVFGEVIKGMDVADKIVNAPKGPQDRPNNPVAIQSVTIRDAQPGEISAGK